MADCKFSNLLSNMFSNNKVIEKLKDTKDAYKFQGQELALIQFLANNLMV